MTVIAQPLPAPTPIDGIAHATWAGAADGLSQLSLWRQSIAAGGCTPPHRHDCDEVVLCLAGHGELRHAGRCESFAAGATVVLPRDRVHQIASVGPGPLEVIGIFGASPVPTRQPDGVPLELPWPT